MGQATLEKTDRNKFLVDDYNSGKYSMVDLVVKYEITPQRIYKIIERQNAKTQG